MKTHVERISIIVVCLLIYGAFKVQDPCKLQLVVTRPTLSCHRKDESIERETKIIDKTTLTDL